MQCRFLYKKSWSFAAFVENSKAATLRVIRFTFLISLLIEGFVEEPSGKDMVIAFFLECFKAATLRKSYR